MNISKYDPIQMILIGYQIKNLINKDDFETGQNFDNIRKDPQDSLEKFNETCLESILKFGDNWENCIN